MRTNEILSAVVFHLHYQYFSQDFAGSTDSGFDYFRYMDLISGTPYIRKLTEESVSHALARFPFIGESLENETNKLNQALIDLASHEFYQTFRELPNFYQKNEPTRSKLLKATLYVLAFPVTIPLAIGNFLTRDPVDPSKDHRERFRYLYDKSKLEAKIEAKCREMLASMK